ncbi:MAG: hypothetical protein SFX18_09775 [Pirellulales bacterium]|nr:hypothetical protein [Pirellulales bacterium]
MQDFWNHIAVIWNRASWTSIALYVGLALLSLAVMVLMRTKWGQTQPLTKCIGLSVLAHLLLALYAMTIEIVHSPAGASVGQGIHATLIDLGPVAWEQLAPPVDQPSTDAHSTPGDAPELQSATDLEHLAQLAPQRSGELLRASKYNATVAKDPAAQAATSEPQPLPENAPPTLDASPKASDQVARMTPLPAQDPLPVTHKAASPPSPVSPAMAAVPVAIVAKTALPVTGTDVTAKSITQDSTLSTALQPPAEPQPSGELPPAAVGSPPIAPSFPATNTNQPGSVVAASTAVPQAALSSNASGAIPDNPGNTLPASLPSSAARQVDSPAVSGQNVQSIASTPPSNPGIHVPAIYQDRFAADRLTLLKSRGGTIESEAAVQAALAWLAAAQSPDGSWNAAKYGAGAERQVLGHNRAGAGAKADTAMTGLALLAFLGAGHTHLEGKYSTNVRLGLEYLLSVQARDGNLSGQAELFAAMYAHGMATLAISEALAMSRDTRLESAVRKALNFTIAAQHLPTGSWRYQTNEPGDMSQLGWQLMALKSGEAAGISIPAATREGMVRFIRSASGGTHGGLAAYRAGERMTRPMTAEGLVCRQFLGMQSSNPAGQEAAVYLLGELPHPQRINLYYWYYGTLGMYQQGGPAWEKWNQALQATLLPRQVISGTHAGSWDPDCVWGGYGGRVYSTAMGALCLEIYYRYLPMYQRER